MRASSPFDFAIVGAGLTGAALAYGLARLGKSVVVLERRERVQLLAQPAHGLLWAQGNLGVSEIRREWNNLALASWREFNEQLCQISASFTHYERPGGVWLGTDALAMQGRRLQADSSAVNDPNLDWLDNTTLRRLVHNFSDAVVGGSYCADDGQLNLHLFYRALDRALDNLNVERCFMHTVDSVRPQDAGYSLFGNGFELEASQVVLATGGQSPELTQVLGFEPLHTEIHTLWQTAQLRHFMPFPAWQLRQARNGSLLIPVDDEGADSDSWQAALAALPSLAQQPVIKQWHDTRCATADGLPHYQRSPEFQGVFRVASPDSLLHCPLHANQVSAWLAGKLSDQAMAPFFKELDGASLNPTRQPLSVEPEQLSLKNLKV